MGTIWTFILIWGVWLITPILVDGVDAVWRLIVIRTHQVERKRKGEQDVADRDLPSVTVIVPAHNEAEVIDRCLCSIKAQDVPHEKLEVIVIDDGSTDDTADRVEQHVNGSASGDAFLLRGRHIAVGPFGGRLLLVRNGHAGKAHALNAGIEASTGDIIVNIDSDVVLAPSTVRNIATYFVRHPEVGAATGNIEIDWDIIEERDSDGRLVLDEKGDLKPRKLTAMQRFLAKSQYLEYLSSFDLGRRAEAIDCTMYTLAGACSAFRREALGGELRYSNASVSEDTLLTFELHRRGVRCGFIDDARVHLEPVIDWDGLYAQRVRWARGQLEVVGVNEDAVASRKLGRFSRIGVPKMLVYDHTLAFPRLVWMPLLLCFPLIGYSWRIVGVAVVAMFLFYLLLESVNALVAYSISDEHTRERIEQSEWSILTMPMFRFAVFHFRFSGFLIALTEKAEWTTAGPVQMARDDAGRLRLRSIEVLAGLLGGIGAPLTRVVRATMALLLPPLLAILALAGWLAEIRKPGR